MARVTDDERRRVAAALRAESGPSLMKLMQVLRVGGKDIFSRLADLIEPPARCPHYHSGRHYCSVHEDMALVDREALLALADEMERMPQCERLITSQFATAPKREDRNGRELAGLITSQFATAPKHVGGVSRRGPV